MCHKCEQGFKKESELKGHIQLVHSSSSNYENTVNEKDSNNCEGCGHISETRKSLMIHKEKEHIGDSWLVGTKREQNMMTSKQELGATKTEEPSQKKVKKTDTEREEKIKNVSDNMDQKVLNKRKLEEEKESNWQKERQKGETLKLEKTKESKISRKIFAGESQKTISN